MIALLQRCSEASVTIEGTCVAQIEQGLLILLGIEEADGEEDIGWLCRKILALRIFNDEENKMNKSVQDINGDLLVVSQFTLHADVQKGNRPSYVKAAPPAIAKPLYEKFLTTLESLWKPVGKGIFGADMKVKLLNDGPVTIILNSKNKQSHN